MFVALISASTNPFKNPADPQDAWAVGEAEAAEEAAAEAVEAVEAGVWPGRDCTDS